jgi:hypothetical protein
MRRGCHTEVATERALRHTAAFAIVPFTFAENRVETTNGGVHPIEIFSLSTTV